jgi:hypothetical protein
MAGLLGGLARPAIGLKREWVSMLFIIIILLQSHRKTLRIQQHPASAFTAAIKNSTWTGQAHTSKTSQANTTQDYSMHSSVGTLRPAQKLAPLDPANMPTDARHAKKLLLYCNFSILKSPWAGHVLVDAYGPPSYLPGCRQSPLRLLR